MTKASKTLSEPISRAIICHHTPEFAGPNTLWPFCRSKYPLANGRETATYLFRLHCGQLHSLRRLQWPSAMPRIPLRVQRADGIVQNLVWFWRNTHQELLNCLKSLEQIFPEASSLKKLTSLKSRLQLEIKISKFRLEDIFLFLLL